MRRSLAALLILCVGIPIYGWIAAYDFSTLAFQDSIEYLAMADFYRSMFGGAADAHAIAYYRSTRLPPVYPLLLAAVGAGTLNSHAATLLTAATSILAALAFWWWLRRERGRDVVATLIPIALLLYPAFFLVNLQPVSEPLSMVVLGCVLALLCRDVSPSRLLIAGLLIGLAPLIRTAMLPLVVAFGIWMLIVRPGDRRTRLLAFAAATLPIAVWMAHRAAIGSQSYAGALTASALVSQLGSWPDLLWLQPMRWFQSVVGNWGPPVPAYAAALTAILLLVAVVGWWLRLRRNAIDAWFLPGYVLMILIWPYPYELGRFMVVVYPLILVCCVTALETFPAPSASQAPRHGRYALLWTLLVLVSLPAGLQFLQRAMLPVDDALLGDKRERPFFRATTDERALMSAEVLLRTRFLAEEAANHIPADECAYSVHPVMQRVYGRIRTLHYPLDLANVAPEVASERLRACDWYFLAGFDVAEPPLPSLYPYKALLGWTDAVLYSRIEHAKGVTPAGILLRRKTAAAPAATNPPTTPPL